MTKREAWAKCLKALKRLEARYIELNQRMEAVQEQARRLTIELKIIGAPTPNFGCCYDNMDPSTVEVSIVSVGRENADEEVQAKKANRSFGAKCK